MNLPGAQVHHERAKWLDLGVNCPDASHLTRFNTIGNQPEIRAFWRQKLVRDVAEPETIYAEGTHLHAKAGLIENLDLVPGDCRVVLIALRRDPLKVVWSLHNRFDFVNFGFTWIFTLDPRYRNVIASYDPLRKFGTVGSAIWYVIEMQTRAAYYRKLTSDQSNVDFLDISLEEIVTDEGAHRLITTVTGRADQDVVLPPPANELTQTHFGEDVFEMAGTGYAPLLEGGAILVFFWLIL